MSVGLIFILGWEASQVGCRRKSLHVLGVDARPVSDLLPSALDVCARS